MHRRKDDTGLTTPSALQVDTVSTVKEKDMIDTIKSAMGLLIADKIDGVVEYVNNVRQALANSINIVSRRVDELEKSKVSIDGFEQRLKAIEGKADDFGFNVRKYVEERLGEGDFELSDKQVKRCISDRQIKDAAEEAIRDLDFADDIKDAIDSLAGNGQLDDCFDRSEFIKALHENEEFMNRLARAMLDAVAEKRIRK